MDAAKIHQRSTVVDLHNDLILLVDHFDRRLRPEHFGDFWLAELTAGGVNVQVLPICLEDQFQSEGGLRRTLLLIERIHALAQEYTEDVQVCLTGAEIDATVRSGRIALVIALEGAHGVGQDVALISAMERVGVRLISIAHFGRTFLADGSGLDETSRGRLTPQGVEALEEMERLGIVFDVSHLGIAGVDDVLSRASRPLLATHSACLGITDSHRNLGDEQIKGIAGLGGVVGVAAAIPYFIDASNPTAERVVDHIEHVANLAGIDHVGLGPDIIDDYYQAVYGEWMPIPGQPAIVSDPDICRPSDLPKITKVMVDRGFSEEDIAKVLGANVLRVLDIVMGRPSGDRPPQRPALPF